MPVITGKGKIRQGRGTGEGATYKPWILTREFNSTGTTANIIDWKHGRSIQLLSAGEEMYYYLFRWDDNVVDIREQYPLDITLTRKIAEKYGISHPKTTMTTDLLVFYKDKSKIAVSVKSDRTSIDYASCDGEEQKNRVRTMEKLFIEKHYWMQKGVQWKLLFKEDLNPEMISNIRRVVVYYDANRVHDPISKVKHLIATKQLIVDMDKPIDYLSLSKSLPLEE